MAGIQVSMTAPWQLLAPQHHPKVFGFNNKPSELFYLRAIFVRKGDARLFAKIQRWKGWQIRVWPLPQTIQQTYGAEYGWGVWVLDQKQETP